MRWYGHVKRREEAYVGRRVLEMELPGKRKVGRPKRMFVVAVNRGMKEVEVNEGDVHDKKLERKNPLWRPLVE